MPDEAPAEVRLLRTYREELEGFARRAILERWTLRRLMAEVSTLPEPAADAFVYVLADLVITALRRRLELDAPGR